MNNAQYNQLDNNEYNVTIVDGVTIYCETDEIVLDMDD